MSLVIFSGYQKVITVRSIISNYTMQRTTKQNNNYWAWITEMSNQLVLHGVDLKEIIEVPIMATPEILHEVVTKKLIKSLYGKGSSKDLTTVEMMQVVNIIRDVFIKRTDGEINIPFNEKDMPDL